MQPQYRRGKRGWIPALRSTRRYDGPAVGGTSSCEASLAKGAASAYFVARLRMWR
jgi:hypothetical protein